MSKIQCIYCVCVGGLPSDPRTWSREDVCLFLQYCEREFDLEKIDMEKFIMNGEFAGKGPLPGSRKFIILWDILIREDSNMF